MAFLKKNDENLRDMANAVRFLCADMIEKSKSGHPGMPLGCCRRFVFQIPQSLPQSAPLV
mgnify:CR=1 FL=1